MLVQAKTHHFPKFIAIDNTDRHHVDRVNHTLMNIERINAVEGLWKKYKMHSAVVGSRMRKEAKQSSIILISL